MGGERAKYKKKYSREWKLNEKKIHTRQLALKIFMLRPKKNLYTESNNEKKFLRLENSQTPSPITFLMVRP